MALKDLAALYGRVALIVIAFAFIAGIIAGPMLQKAGLRSSATAAQDRSPLPELIRTNAALASSGQN